MSDVETRARAARAKTRLRTTYSEWFRDPPATVQGLLQPEGGLAIAACLDVQAERGIGGSLAEIGTFAGKTFIGLALASRPGERVIGVDPFEVNGIKFRYHFDYNTIQHLPDETLERLTVVHAGSETLTPAHWTELLGLPARFVHVDGDHTQKAIQHDLALASASLAPGAVVVLDDIFNETCPDLTTGMIDGLRHFSQLVPIALIPRLGPHQEGGAKLVCGDPALATVYVDAMARTLTMLKATTREFLGAVITVFFTPMGQTQKALA
jgi:methyltransferase family protein